MMKNIILIFALALTFVLSGCSFEYETKVKFEAFKEPPKPPTINLIAPGKLPEPKLNAMQLEELEKNYRPYYKLTKRRYNVQ